MPASYGKRIRELVNEAKKKSGIKYNCPSCSRLSVKRQASGLWFCRKCKRKFASDAFEFK
ncbi:MAG: 50S ribosomal protein L37ae [Candidatus Aenigmatarchaeota archaeon]